MMVKDSDSTGFSLRVVSLVVKGCQSGGKGLSVWR